MGFINAMHTFRRDGQRRREIGGNGMEGVGGVAVVFRKVWRRKMGGCIGDVCEAWEKAKKIGEEMVSWEKGWRVS
jgi:hypothetical protein